MDGKVITKALESAVEALFAHVEEHPTHSEVWIVEKVYVEQLADELATYRALRDEMGKAQLQKTPAIYPVIALLRERFKLSPSVFSDNEIAAAWSNVQGMSISEQMSAFCQFMGISED